VLLAACVGPAVAGWCREVRHYLPLIERVMTQTRRRVFDGKAVPANEKVVSLFELSMPVEISPEVPVENSPLRCCSG
jgi:IS5 family transposase